MAVIDLGNLAAFEGFRIIGDVVDDRAGRSVSSAGDINGDGFDDFIVGAHRNDTGGIDAGATYVIFGKANGFANIDLATMTAADGFRIIGDVADDRAGLSVSSAGDINGDGFDDLIVGAQNNDAGGNYAGAAYVIFGKASGFANIDLATLAPADGFRIIGDAALDFAGQSVSSAGDINGDGFDDIIVGASGNDAGGYSAGVAYVIFGKAGGFADIDLTTLGAADGIRIIGDVGSDLAGHSVSSAGDINGDGFDDIIIGARGNDAGGNGAGAAYIIFGKATGLADIDLTTLGAADGIRIIGDAADDDVGISVSSAGDINGDGFDDIIVGAYGNDAGGAAAGAAYVIYGKASGFANIDLGALAPADGFRIIGDAADDFAGYSVSSAGDINGDGFDDLIVGAHRNDAGGANAGAAYVIYGKASGFGSIDLGALTDADGFTIIGDAAGDSAGRSVSSAGDINGDGFDDIMIGAPYNDYGGSGAGAAYVIYGQAPTESVSRVGSEANQTLRGGAFDDTLDGREGDDSLFGAGGDDTLIGGLGDDLLDGGAGADLMSGGAGADSYIVDEVDDFVYERVIEGTDRVDSSISWTLVANVENLTLTGTAAIDGTGNELANVITGNAGANTLSGLGGNDTLISGSGNDTLTGGEGNDKLVGGSGADDLTGGAGNDTYIVSDAGDQVFENNANGGVDRVKSSVSFKLGANLENLTLTGSAAINGTGNGLANIINGNSAANILDGRAGADYLQGGGGADVFLFDDGHFGGLTRSTCDRIIDFSSAGGDLIDLSGVDANSALGGDQAFAFVGAGAFTGNAGQLRYEQINGNTYVYGDTDGDGVADFMLRLDGSHTLNSGDFVI